MVKKFAERLLRWGPVYWNVPFYRTAMAILRPDQRRSLFAEIAREIGACSTLDLCCGDGALRRWIPQNSYWGIDSNPAFVAHLQRRGVRAIEGDVMRIDWPPAECVVMVDSLYHFRECLDALMEKCLSRASRKVIVAESIRHWTGSSSRYISAAAAWGTRVDGTAYPRRYCAPALEAVLRAKGFSTITAISANLLGVWRK